MPIKMSVFVCVHCVCPLSVFDHFMGLLLKGLIFWNHSKAKINPFQTNAPFLYPLKTSETWKFFDFFRGYRNAILAWDRLIHLCYNVLWSMNKFSRLCSYFSDGRVFTWWNGGRKWQFNFKSSLFPLGFPNVEIQ